MSSLVFAGPMPAGRGERRLAAIALTLAVHLVLFQAWQLTRRMPPAAPEETGPVTQWLRLPELGEPAPPLPSAPALAMPREPARSERSARAARIVEPVTVLPTDTAIATPDVAAPEAPASAQPSLPDAATILENARNSAGGIERALRAERMPTIVAPPDSPEIRMRRGMEHARAMAPPRLWEAPKVDELVNQTGDGARRTRINTGNGTYCITERAPTTSIDMIEKHGRQRFTNCPQHEEPAKRQEWRTARD